MTNFFVKGYKDHNPSLKISDIRLSDGWYLIKKLSFKEGMVESEAGIWMLVDGKNGEPDIAKVVKVADKGCDLAKVGEYVMIMVPGGNENDNLKPFPLVRVLGDLEENNFWVVHNDHIPLVIPPEKVVKK